MAFPPLESRKAALRPDSPKRGEIDFAPSAAGLYAGNEDALAMPQDSLQPPPVTGAELSLSTKRCVLVWSLLVLLAVVRVGSTWREFSATLDEGRHVAASVEVYDTRAYTVYYANPPLSRWFTGALPYFFGARMPTGDIDAALGTYLEVTNGDREHATGKYVLEESPDYWDTLAGARAGNLVFLIALLYFVYRWSAELFGRLAGLASTAIASASPLILGHGALATTDLPATAMGVVAAYGLWKWSIRPDRRHAILAGLGIGLAIATKATVPPFLVLSAAGLLLVNQGRALVAPENYRPAVLAAAAGRLALMGIAAFLVVWATYDFELGIWMERSPWLNGAIDNRLEVGGVVSRVVKYLMREVPLPLDVLPDAIQLGKQETGRAWPAYLFGEIHPGIYHYFLAGMGLKSTIGFLMLIPASLAAFARRPRAIPAAGYLSVLGLAFVFLLGPSLSRMNIGMRHVMPVYAFLAIFFGAIFVRRSGFQWVRLGWVLFALHFVESALVHPNYLAHLNPIGQSWQKRNDLPPLLDSNLDWGQDQARLARWCADNEVDEITLSVFGSRYSTSPVALGMEGAHLLEPTERPVGWFAISYNHLLGIGMSVADYDALDRFDWLREHEPRALVGQSIRVYHLP